MEPCDAAWLEENARGRFLLVLAPLFPPCAFSSSSLVSSSAMENVAAPSFAWPDEHADSSGGVEIATLLLANEVGVGGGLFNLCVDIFAERPSHSHQSLLSPLQSALFAVLTDYRCPATHGTNGGRVGLATSSAVSRASDCALTPLLRAAAAMVARNETWWTTASCAGGPVACEDVSCDLIAATATATSGAQEAVQKMCAFVVSLAHKVFLTQRNVMRPPSGPRRGVGDSHKRRREGTSDRRVAEKWFAVRDSGFFPRLQHAPDIAKVLCAKDSTGTNNADDAGTHVDREALSEVGSVLAVVSEACEARTLRDISAWQYGRNRITLASVTVVMQQVSMNSHSAGENKQTGVADTAVEKNTDERDGGHLSHELVVDENGSHELLGYFLHETGTLYTARGGRYIMETD